jgi:hypothetical protein
MAPQAAKHAVHHTVADVMVCVDGRTVTVREVPAIRTPRHDEPLVSLDLLKLLEIRLRARGFRAGSAVRYATLVR